MKRKGSIIITLLEMAMRCVFIFIWIFINTNLRFVFSTNYSCSSDSTCGCSLKAAILTKIVGGEDAQTDSWGWAVSIRFRDYHRCGGSLISSEFVISAAHCFASLETVAGLTVTVGSKFLSRIKQQRSISAIFIHRYYDSFSYSHDIAILRLSSPFDMNDRSLALICLPNTTIKFPTYNTDVVAIGWGVLSVDDDVVPDTLQQVTLKPVVNTDKSCKSVISNTKLQFCAGVPGGGKDTCQGDSGGPLMVFSNQQWYLIGITSYGMGCATPDHAGVYTRLSAYEDWIDCILQNETLCSEEIIKIISSVSSTDKNIFNINYFFISFLIIYFI